MARTDRAAADARAAWPPEVLRIAAVALAYFVVARLSLLLEFQPEGIAAVWPPSGIFLSAVLLTRAGLRPAVVATLAVTDLCVEWLAGTPWRVSALYAGTLAADASLSAWLLLRYLGAPPTFGRVRDFVAFFLLSVLLSNGLTSLVAAEASLQMGAPSFWNAWLWWAASGGIGNLLVTPLVLSGTGEARGGVGDRRAKAIEATALLFLLAVASAGAFAWLAHSTLFLLVLPYATFPFQIWAALRLGVRGVAAATLVIAAVTIAYALHGSLASIQDSRLGVVIAVQMYLAVMAVPTLLLAAVVSERRRAERERDRIRAQAEESRRMEALGRLSGGIAHDFNNMLCVILGRANLALGAVEPDRNDLLEIRDAALRSAQLTSQLLAFARRQPSAPRTLDLGEQLTDALKMLRRLIGEEIALSFAPPAGLWPVRMDGAQLDQVVANLCVNARDAIGGAGRIWIEAANVTLDEPFPGHDPRARMGDYVMLSVSDDGAGMPREVLEHIFEPFFTTKEAGRGTGLGLATVYGIVRQNGGAVDVYSEQGLGTTFKLFFPRAAGEAVATAPAREAAPPRGQGETLLVVEDDRAVRGVVKAMLERLGYGVLEAGAPAEAIRLIEHHVDGIRLLLTDIALPQMSGRELAGRVQALQPAIRTLYMSGYAPSALAVVEGGAPFIQKPFSADALALKVREALDRARGGC